MVPVNRRLLGVAGRIVTLYLGALLEAFHH